MASCAVCGKEVPVESKFCVHCGNAMESPLANSKSPTTAKQRTPSQSVPSATPNMTPTDRGLVMRGVGSTAGFALLYAALMVPTYVLPYFGSNSAIVGALGAAIGRGLMPQTWAHIWFLTLLILVAWMRGATVHKGFLPAISFCAALFDMTPVLNGTMQNWTPSSDGSSSHDTASRRWFHLVHDDCPEGNSSAWYRDRQTNGAVPGLQGLGYQACCTGPAAGPAGAGSSSDATASNGPSTFQGCSGANYSISCRSNPVATCASFACRQANQHPCRKAATPAIATAGFKSEQGCHRSDAQ